MGTSQILPWRPKKIKLRAVHTGNALPAQGVAGIFVMEGDEGESVGCVGDQLFQLDLGHSSPNSHLQGG